MESFPIQIQAIATILDLVSLTQSVMDESLNKGDQDDDGYLDLVEDRPEQSLAPERDQKPSQHGTVSVVIRPSLTPDHLQFLSNKTNFYKVNKHMKQKFL